MSPSNQGRGHEPSRRISWLVLCDAAPWLLVVALFTVVLA